MRSQHTHGMPPDDFPDDYGSSTYEESPELGTFNLPAGWAGRPNGPRAYKKSAVCKYCNRGNLTWKSTENGWRLFDDNKLHVCRTSRLSNYTKDVDANNEESADIPISLLSQLVDPCATLDEVQEAIRKIRKIMPN